MVVLSAKFTNGQNLLISWSSICILIIPLSALTWQVPHPQYCITAWRVDSPGELKG